jgi:hypothetical protein
MKQTQFAILGEKKSLSRCVSQPSVNLKAPDNVEECCVVSCVNELKPTNI